VVSSTFDFCVGEVEAALQFMKGKFPKAALGVHGHSLGGLTAMGLIELFND
jgi:alpha-beta hydrolase superfamily lysophospholipase